MPLELLSAGANPSKVDNYLSSTPLIYALGRTALNANVEVLETDDNEVRDKSMELLKYLLENAELSEVIEQSGNNPLKIILSYRTVLYQNWWC